MFPPLSYDLWNDLTFRALYYLISMKEFTVGFVVDVEMRCSDIIVCDLWVSKNRNDRKQEKILFMVVGKKENYTI